MGLADHLFDVQMGKHSRRVLVRNLTCSLASATYSPPNLPDHLSTKLESVSGAPTNEQMIKVQYILLNYQEMRRFPSMFDAHVNMELSQHLFDLQMARHMRMAGESEPILGSEATLKPPVTLLNTPHTPSKTEEAITTNNIGRGADDIEAHYTIHSVTGAETRDLIERSNKLAERFNQLLERSNELLEGRNKSTDSSSTPNSVQQFNQMLERLTQIVEHSQKPAEQFNQLFDRLNQLVELSKQPAQRANELGEQSNNIADRANQLIEQLNQSFGHSNQLSEKANKSLESFAGLLQNINGVLVGIQHAIVRSHKGNTIGAINCLVNDKGQKPGVMHQKYRVSAIICFANFKTTVEALSNSSEYDNIPVAIDGVSQVINLPSHWLGDFLRFYSLGDNLHIHPGSTTLKQGKTREAQNRLGDYLSSCLG
ncbi:PSDC domain-containing protein [Rhizoctonia solani AG-1 IA]|uniref:PSDC domain-containing protein n=1 Tax=Thanatephorus cucumeris (strain AG1-IA) TaxID=983506 RepID=L8WT24_THACA|nr:PSDC domain-containing protein [Rhizoctonia solani AG-1 IA]